MSTKEINDIVIKIKELIKNDEEIDHCRINIVNGSGDIFKKYKVNLSSIEDQEKISVKFYSNHFRVYEDLFSNKLNQDNRFDLFVFNLNYCDHICYTNNKDCDNYIELSKTCKNPIDCVNAKCLNCEKTVRHKLMEEMLGIEFILKKMSIRYDSRFYASMIVSALSQEIIEKIFEESTGETCPITYLRFLDLDFDGHEILEYLYNIIKTHSTEFLSRWDKAINNLEFYVNNAKII